MNKIHSASQFAHGPIALALISWMWIHWTKTFQASKLASTDLSLGWYYFFLSVAYCIVIFLSRRRKANLLQRTQLSMGGHAFFLLAWYAIRLKPAATGSDESMLLNKFYLFAFIVTMTLGLLAPSVIYGKTPTVPEQAGQELTPAESKAA